VRPELDPPWGTVGKVDLCGQSGIRAVAGGAIAAVSSTHRATAGRGDEAGPPPGDEMGWAAASLTHHVAVGRGDEAGPPRARPTARASPCSQGQDDARPHRHAASLSRLL